MEATRRQEQLAAGMRRTLRERVPLAAGGYRERRGEHEFEPEGEEAAAAEEEDSSEESDWESDNGEEREYPLECITGERVHPRHGRQYRVRWTGYRKETWEPAENIASTAALDAWERRDGAQGSSEQAGAEPDVSAARTSLPYSLLCTLSSSSSSVLPALLLASRV